jgi:hypothetical protein
VMRSTIWDLDEKLKFLFKKNYMSEV